MNSLIRNILFSFLLLHSTAICAQNKWLDSVKSVLNTQKPDTSKIWTLITLSESYKQSDPDSGFYYAQQALALAEKLQFDNGIFWSIVEINKSLYALGNYTLELDYAFRAYPLGNKLNNTYTFGWANGMMGDCFYNLSEYDSCIQYYRKILRRAEHDSIIDLPSLYSNLVPVFVKLHQYDSALFFAKKGYALFKSNPILNKGDYETKYYKCFGYRFLGEAFAGKNEYDSALFYYRLSLPYCDDANLMLNKIDIYNGIANAFKEKSLLDSATWYAKRVFTEKITKSYPVGLLYAANTLTNIYESQHNPDSTLKYMRIAATLKDNLYNREKTIAIQNIFFKQKEKEREIAVAAAKLKGKFRMYFLIALLIALLTAAWIAIKSSRQKRLQELRDNIADDLHDDIGSSLSSIAIMNELAKAKLSETLPLLISIGESTQYIQEKMSDIVWAMKSESSRFETITQRMNQYASEIMDVKDIALDFNSDASLSSLKLSMQQRKNVYLFFKEVINNAVKYSDASRVLVRIIQQGRYAEMKICDNGKGFDITEIFRGNGMSSLKKRATDLKGDFKITSQANDGTSVELRFKIKKTGIFDMLEISRLWLI